MTCPSSKCVHTSHLVEPNNASIYFQMSTHPVQLAAKVRGSSCPQSLTWQLPNIFYHLRKHVFSLCGFYFNGFNSLILGASCLHSCELSAFSAYIFFLFECTAAGNPVFFWVSYLVLLLCWGAVFFCTFGWLVGWEIFVVDFFLFFMIVCF